MVSSEVTSATTECFISEANYTYDDGPFTSAAENNDSPDPLMIHALTSAYTSVPDTNFGGISPSK